MGVEKEAKGQKRNWGREKEARSLVDLKRSYPGGGRKGNDSPICLHQGAQKKRKGTIEGGLKKGKGNPAEPGQKKRAEKHRTKIQY